MPILSNTRHEAFAQAWVSGMAAEAAYVAAGYKPSRQNAARLTTNEAILARVAELQEPAVKAAKFDFEVRLRRLAEIALNPASDPRVAVAAIAEANRMTGGHAPAKVEVKHSYAELSDEELAAELAQKEAEAAGLLH